MVVEREEVIFFKKTVDYVVGVRFFVGDVDGKALTPSDPYVWVKESDLRDFKRANKRALREGLIIQTKEPVDEGDNPNMLEDETIEEAVKNVFALKKILADVTAEAPVIRLLEEAKLQKRPTKTIQLIEKRLRDFTGEIPEDMEGEV